MLVVRPVRESDTGTLLELAELTSFGQSTLPRDGSLLRRRIRDSLRGFSKLEDDPPRGESYLFVLEETSTGTLLGTSGIASKVGGYEPFYAYDVQIVRHVSQMLNVSKEIRTLNLVTEHDGPCEIGSLFLRPEGRGSGGGRMLSLARFLFMADHPALFDPRVIAEMRGVVDAKGHSPFWDAVGRHFFDLEFPTADYLSNVDKRFIGELMPRYPIYVPLLPPEAQAVIGQVHEETRPALHLLMREGFAFSGMVDIFEAGPVMRCDRERIRSVRDSQQATVSAVIDAVEDGPTCLISNGRRDLRVCQGRVSVRDQGVAVTGDVAAALETQVGEVVRWVPMRPGGTRATERNDA